MDQTLNRIYSFLDIKVWKCKFDPYFEFMHHSGCLICGNPLVYDLTNISRTCMICGRNADSNASCDSGHFICDACHSSDAADFIEKFCLSYSGTDGLELARQLMQMKCIKMHGPEHHFLVPAVLMTVYYNQMGHHEELEVKLPQARKRAQRIPGGFCGFYGNCGAAVGTGLAISLITDTTPLSTDTWQLCNLATARSLASVARFSGPRCCKRDTYLSLIEGIHILKKEFGIPLPEQKVSCMFTGSNKECLKKECAFYNQI